MARPKSKRRQAGLLKNIGRRMEELEDRRLLTVINWNGLGDGTTFTQGANWVGGVAPGSSDDAVINVGGSPTIALSSNVTVHSLASNNNFSITGGNLTVDATSSVSATLTINSNGTLIASGSGTTFSASGATTVSNANLFAQSGATLSLPNLTSYSDSTNTYFLEATGAGSVLSLNGLTSLSCSANQTILVEGLSGGHVNMTSLASVTTAPVQLISNGTGSQVNVPALATFSGATGFNNSLIEVQANGTFSHAAGLTSINHVDLDLDGATTTIDLSSLTSITNGNITVSSGGTLSLPNVTSYSDSANTYVLQATGAGSVLSMNALTSLSTSANQVIIVEGVSGGHVNMTSLASVTTSPVQFISNGTNSQVNVTALATFTGTPGFNNSLIEVEANGTFSHAAGLTAISHVDLTLDGATTTIDLSSLTSITNGNITVSSGGTLSLPNVTSYSDSANTYVLQATGAGSVLSMNALTSLSTSANQVIIVQGLSGGHVNMTSLASVTTSPVQFFSTGTGSQVNVPALATFTGTPGSNNSLIEVQANGTFSHAAGLTAISHVDLTLDGATTTIDLSSLTSISNGNITVSSGGTLSLPNVASYSDSANTYVLQATGAGSVLSMNALTSLSTSANQVIIVEGVSGGHVNMTSLASVTTSPVQFISNGTNSQVNVTALATFTGTPGFNNSLIEVEANGTFSHAAGLTAISHVDLTLDGATTTIDLSSLTSITNGNITASGGGTLSLPNVTSYSDSANTYALQATGAGSVLSMNALTSLSTSANQVIIVEGVSGGHVNMTSLASVTTSPVQFISNGTNSQVNVTALATFTGATGFNNSLIEVEANGTFSHAAGLTSISRVDLDLDGATTTIDLSSLTSMSNGSITASGGGTLSLPNVASYSDSANTYVLQATGAGSVLSMNALTSLSTSGSQTIDVEAVSGGQTNMTALVQVTTAPIQFVASGASSQINVPALTTFLGFSSSGIQVFGGGTFADGNNVGTLLNDVNLTGDPTGTITIASNQTYANENTLPGFVIDRSPASQVNLGTLAIQGAIAPYVGGTINVHGNLTLNTQGIISSAAYGTINITGNLLGSTQNSNAYNAQGNVVFNGSGTLATPQQLEAMSNDLGAVQSGFNKNFAYGTITLTGGTRVQLVDLAHNSAGVGAEAVYVDKLIVQPGTTLDLNGLHLYVRDASQVAGTVTGGTITTVTGSVVVNTQLFYAGSTKFDVSGFWVPFSDDNAIAFDKVAYLPGGGATTFSNMSSYSKGLNGVVVDITGSHPGIVASDFTLKVGSNNTPSTWAAAPAPTTVTVRSGAGTGSDRVELIWANNAIQNTWLEVTVKADANTGLSTPDIFFFGDHIGDSGLGNSASFSVTSATDEIAARNNGGINQMSTSPYDFDRNGIVNATDQIIVRNNAGTLRFINISNPPGSPAAVASSTVGGDTGVASGLAALTSSTGSKPGLPAWAGLIGKVDLNGGPVGTILEHLAKENTKQTRSILVAVDKVADELGVDDDLLDSLLADLGLE